MNNMLSIWEKNEFINYTHIIIGSGIVGLCTAYYIKKKYPNQSVLVLERGLLPSGASTKNAGFACMGSASELLEYLKTETEVDVIDLFLQRKKGLERLQALLGTEQIGYKQNGSYELLFDGDEEVLEKIDYLNQILSKDLKHNPFSLNDEKLKDFKFDKSVKHLIKNNCEGEIDTGLMMKNLIKKVMAEGVEIKTGCNVLRFEETKNEINIFCKNPITDSSENEIVFQCSKLFICNNAFAKSFLPDEDITPGRGQVLITKPIPNLYFKGIFHFNKGYYYFREYKNCILFGGGRNLDFETENTTQLELNQQIQNDLKHKLQNIIIPNTTFEIDLQWSGIMAFGKIKKPILKQQSDNIFIGVRMNGMGIAIGADVGFQLCEMI